MLASWLFSRGEGLGVCVLIWLLIWRHCSNGASQQLTDRQWPVQCVFEQMRLQKEWQKLQCWCTHLLWALTDENALFWKCFLRVCGTAGTMQRFNTNQELPYRQKGLLTTAATWGTRLSLSLFPSAFHSFFPFINLPSFSPLLLFLSYLVTENEFNNSPTVYVRSFF